MISWFQIQTWQVRGGSNPIRPFFHHFWRGWTSIDHHRSKMIEAIEAILTWTPGYSPRAFRFIPWRRIRRFRFRRFRRPRRLRQRWSRQSQPSRRLRRARQLCHPSNQRTPWQGDRWWSLHGDGDGLKIDSWEMLGGWRSVRYNMI